MSQLVWTFLKHTARYVVWTACFLWVDSPQGPVYISWVQTENLVIGALYGWCVIQCIKPSKVAVQVVEEVIIIIALKGGDL